MTRIYHITSKCVWVLLALTAFFFTSCIKEVFAPPFYEGDGTEVTINIPVGFTDYEHMTRSLTENESKRLDDLYLFIFHSSTGALQYRKYYNTRDLEALVDAESQPNHSNAKVVPVTLPTGTYKIAAVANCNAGHLSQELSEKLLQVQNWEEFYNLDLELNEFYPINRSRMPMSGYYQAADVVCSGVHTCPDVVINGQGNLRGYIHLRRVDAEVKFNIYNDIDGHYAGLDGVSGDYMQTCTKFEILGWQLVNMPKNAYVAEHETDKADAEYVNTIWQGITRPDPNVGDGAWKLDFYMMENRKSANGLTKYEQRELNEANEGRGEDEDPHFIKAPSNSTYLKFSANIEISLSKGSETIKRIASATYYVHLGATYPKGGPAVVDYNDFNTERNTKYTYNVRVQGVDKIVVEAISTEDPNDKFQNGQEGMVIDLAGGKIIDLDAHYAVFNIELSRLEMSQMGIIITSAAHPSGVSYIPGAGPDGSDLNDLNVTCDDYQHIRFAPLSAQRATIPNAELVVYSNTYDVKALSDHPTEAQAKEGGILPLEDEPTQAKDANHYVPLYDFITLKKSYPLLDDGHDEDPITFTVFVSEYYYYNDFNLHHDTELGEENWQKFTNTINRQYSLLSNVHVSTDEHSTHVTGKYVINQRSIQTYYGMDSEEGLGVEHVNEHYHKNMVGSAPSTKRTNNGWFNSAFYMGLMTSGGGATNSARWADWTSQDCAIGHESFNDFYPTFKTKFSESLTGDGNYKGGKNRVSTDDRNVNYYAIPACLARNRDLNRNGIIETDELRWFLPGIQQYVQLAIGIAALETPIFRPADFENSIDYDTSGGRANNIYGNVRYHFISSDHWKMWAEEGSSISSLGNNSVGNAWEIRCCRYLKANGQYTSSDSQLIVAHPYNHNDANRVVNVHGYDEKCLRENTAVLPVRDNFDTKWNSLARNFQYASTTIQRPEARNVAALARDVDANVYCKNYHDPIFGADTTDIGTWRIPNQRELAIMFYEGKASDGYFAGTFWYYGNYTNGIVYGYDDAAAESGAKYFGNFGVRSGNLCLNHSNNLNACRTIRCVRDTDKDGNPAGSPEYGDPVNFVPGDLGCTYTGDLANYMVNASMNGSLVSSVSVKIDGYDASTTGSGAVKSTVSGAEVNKSQITVTWTIVMTSGKTLNYTKTYNLPARYWLISRYSVNDRYVTVNQNNDQTYIGANDYRNPDDIDAIYKWVITKDPAGKNPVNESELTLGSTYYVFNAGTEQYISGPTSGSQNYMVVGRTPMTMKLSEHQTRSGHYVLRFNNATNANSYGGDVSKFGVWNSDQAFSDDGSAYKLTPAVMKGAMPLSVTLAQHLDESASSYAATATVDDVSRLTKVTATINGRPATVTNSGNTYTAVPNNDDPAHIVARVSWTFTNDGTDHSYERLYVIENRIPTNPYVISQKNFLWYVYANNNAAYTENSNNTTPIKQLADKYRWVLVDTETYTMPNQSELPSATGVWPFPAGTRTYMMYNVATKQFLTGPLSANLVNIGLSNEGEIVKFKMQRDTNSDYSSKTNVYCLFVQSPLVGWVNRISVDSSFGFWQNGDNRLNDAGNGWTFNQLQFDFAAGELTTNYSQNDGTRATFSCDATFESALAQFVSVAVNGVTVPSPVVSGDNISFTMANALIPENGQAEVAWTFKSNGADVVMRRVYELPVKFYLIKSILSSASYGYQYAYVDSEGKTRSVTTAADMDKSRAEMRFRWILSGDTASPSKNILASEVVVNGNRNLYLYNQAAQAYITKHSPAVNFSDFLVTGSSAHRFCFDAAKNGGFRPYFKWDGTNTYGSCANSSRNPDKNKFGFSQAGVDGAYWIFVPVYRDNAAEIPLNFEFGSITGTSGSYSSTATMSQGADLSVTINGVNAEVTHSGNNYTASVTGLTNDQVIYVKWDISYKGQNYSYTKLKVNSNVPYWAFRHGDYNQTAYVNTYVADVSGATRFVNQVTPEDVARWVVLKAGDDSFAPVTTLSTTNQSNSVSGQRYILLNIGTGKFMGPASGNAMSMVDNSSDAQLFVIYNNGKHCIHFLNGSGSAIGWCNRNSDQMVGINSGLSHSFWFERRTN